VAFEIKYPNPRRPDSAAASILQDSTFTFFYPTRVHLNTSFLLSCIFLSCILPNGLYRE
jgi:hypothetical protein